MKSLEHFSEKNLLALRNTRIANSLNLCALTIPTETDFSGLMLMGLSQVPRSRSRSAEQELHSRLTMVIFRHNNHV